jgi:hypothetical protein
MVLVEEHFGGKLIEVGDVEHGDRGSDGQLSFHCGMLKGDSASLDGTNALARFHFLPLVRERAIQHDVALGLVYLWDLDAREPIKGNFNSLIGICLQSSHLDLTSFRL